MSRKRCSVCGELDHNKRKHRKPRAGASKAWRSDNAGYAANRKRGLCDACGKRSRKSRCAGCTARRRAQPSRTREYRRAHERVGSGQRNASGGAR